MNIKNALRNVGITIAAGLLTAACVKEVNKPYMTLPTDATGAPVTTCQLTDADGEVVYVGRDLDGDGKSDSVDALLTDIDGTRKEYQFMRRRSSSLEADWKKRPDYAASDFQFHMVGAYNDARYVFTDCNHNVAKNLDVVVQRSQAPMEYLLCDANTSRCKRVRQ
jgi:hypothetical protein